MTKQVTEVFFQPYVHLTLDAEGRVRSVRIDWADSLGETAMIVTADEIEEIDPDHPHVVNACAYMDEHFVHDHPDRDALAEILARGVETGPTTAEAVADVVAELADEWGIPESVARPVVERFAAGGGQGGDDFAGEVRENTSHVVAEWMVSEAMFGGEA